MAIQHQYDDDQVSDLIINVPPKLRRRLTMAAAQNNLSIQEYVERILEETVPPELDTTHERRRGLNRAAVDKLLQTREAIMRAHPGQIFEDSSELIHQARGERTKELEQR